jgi:hypothetical protein
VYISAKKHFRQLRNNALCPAYWLTFEFGGRLFKAIPSDDPPLNEIIDILNSKNCRVEHKIVGKKARLIYDYSIKSFSFDTDGFDVEYFDDRKKHYLWDEIISVSPLTAMPYRIKFSDGTEISLHHREQKFKFAFRMEYEMYLDRLDGLVFDFEPATEPVKEHHVNCS